MTTAVTKESLMAKIKALESRGNAEYALGLTLNEEFQLAAYRALLATMDSDPIVEMFVAEIVKHLVSALERPVVLGPVTVNSDTDHLLLEREVIAVLGPRYPMFKFTGLSSASYLHIGIAAALNQK